MQNIVVDSGPLVALFDRSDKYHKQAVQFVKELEGRLVTNIAVITEVVYLLDFSQLAQSDFLYWIDKVASIDCLTDKDLPRIIEVMQKYGDLPADFADASLVALCERLSTTNIASIDKDFVVYRTADKKAFTNLFYGKAGTADAK